MPERVRIDPEQGIVEIVAYDEVTIQDMYESRELIMESLEKHPIAGFLYDGRQVTHAPKGQALFDFVKMALSNKLAKGMHIAVVTNKKSVMPHSFLTATARRLGFFARVFHEHQTAMDWLCEGDNTNCIADET